MEVEGVGLGVRRPIMIAILWLSLVFAGVAQDAVPGEILVRTRFIRIGDSYGTAFGIDYKGKLYLVTAKHVVAGLPEGKATVQVRGSTKWEDIHTGKTLFPASDDVDIAVLETDELVSHPFAVTTGGGLRGISMGQQVWFLGYPFGIGSRWSTGEAAFIKRGTMSAIDASNPNAVVLYIDGFNNPGFSGGPIVYWDFSSHTYAILGVVKGYKEDTAKVMVGGEHVDTKILVNSGILVGYSIEHAIQAIEKNQKQPKTP